MIVEDEAALLAELRAISDRSGRSRATKPIIQGENTCSRSREKNADGVDLSNVACEGFLDVTPEDSHLNQYWYSKSTIQNLCQAVIEGLESNNMKKAAFLSTPSLYFSLPPEIKENCVLLDYDKTWSSDPGFVFYDYNDPKNLSSALCRSFDMVVIDPPFIAEEVWSKYTETATFLLKGDPKESSSASLVIGTTVQENAPFMEKLLGVKPAKFLPSIPNLVYQYSVFTNFTSTVLSNANPEIAVEL
uniref:Protein-lysine N-methyltransferase n=1 Tax=Helicotheca tamesis TaxID=374047 RepID=A0A7S2MJD6_9STRA|mmetsp:Transcript_16919/g.23203  ORF Transcript_16919/g.23203 Transcript_16919/m.23203 type:complete len:246 (+) Transcript_16919:122-859(+)